MNRAVVTSLVLLTACGVPDVVGTWQGDERNAYTLLRSGGITNDVLDLYPIEDPSSGTAEQLEMTFRRDGTVDFVNITLDLAVDPPQELGRDVETWDFVGRGPVTLDIVGRFDGDDFECNVVAGPDLLTCNLTTDIDGGVDVVSYLLWRPSTAP